MRILRWLGRWLLGLLLLLVLLVAAVWWWSGTEGSLDWTLQRLARSQPLTTEGARGSLRSGIHVDRLTWQQEGLRVEATDVQLAWNPLSLLRATVKLQRLHAGTLRVEDRSPPSTDPRQPPDVLGLPLRVAADELAIDRLEWVAERSFEATAIRGGYEYNGAQHAVQLRNLEMAGGSYQGEASLGARGTKPLAVNLRGRLQTEVPGAPRTVPVSFSATARGPLEDFQAQVVMESALAGTATTAAMATVTARLTPWAEQPVPQARADLSQFDLGAFWPEAPRTSLAGQVQLQPLGTATWTVTADLRNDQPGPWDRRRLPVETLRAEGEWRLAGQALVRSLEARLGGGRLQASGDWEGAQGWTVQGTLEGINPAALHGAMAALPLGGRLELSGEGEAVLFDVALQAQGRRQPPRQAGGRATRAASELAVALRALALREASARGRWQGGLLTLAAVQVRTDDARLQGALELRPATRSGAGRVDLQAPGLRLRADGRLAERSGGGVLQLEAPDVATAQRWLQRLPGAPEALGRAMASGNGRVQLAWQGGWRDPAIQATAAVGALDVQLAATPGSAAAVPAPWQIREGQFTVNGRLSGAALQARANLRQGERRLGLELAGRGGRGGAGGGAAWEGQVSTLNLRLRDPSLGAGVWTLALQRAFDLRWVPGGSFEAGAGQALLTAPAQAANAAMRPVAAPAVLSWEPVRWRAGELQTAGQLRGLPMAWVGLVGGPELTGSALSGDLVFDASWTASLGRELRLRAELVRTSGDLTVLADTADGSAVRVRAGVREARLSVVGQGEEVTLSLRWDSERAGQAQGRIASRLSRGADGGWAWPSNAPLSGGVQAQLPRIAAWSLLAPPGWRLRGSLAADIAVAGTRSDPQLSGTLSANDLALRSVVDGVELRNGRLRARLEGQRLIVDEFSLRGVAPPGQQGGGTLTASGEGALTPEGLRVTLRAQLDRLRASMREDRQLTVSGNVAAVLAPAGVRVTGQLRVDQGLILIPDEAAPRLGSDVVVRRPSGTVAAGPSPRVSEPTPPSARPLSVAVDVDLGSDFRVRGRGIDTRLRGTLAVSATELSNPRLHGTITTAGGEYRAYGQRLDVERGVIRFTGPIDNPALDILAIRPNLTQRVGVQISGRAQAPLVRLYSEPELSEAEKLSWLVLGRSSASGGAEAALLQQAALALLAARTGGSGPGFASRLGLDELSFSRDGEGGAAVTLGRRFARNFYAAYERSLSGAVGTLFLFFELTQRFTVRAQAGDRTAIDIIYTLSYD